MLYLVYWGAAEPLGRSLVLPILRAVSGEVFLTLMTFEKPADLASRSEREAIKAALSARGIRWMALRYHKWPRWPATMLDVLHGVARALVESSRRRPDIVHARTFIGGVVGAVVAPLVGARLLYHAEGAYADEQVDAGVWAQNSLPHRLVRFVERLVYERADGIVVLSAQARAHVQAFPGVARRTVPVVVVHSCVDVERFAWAARPPWRPGEPLHLVYAGSVEGRYRLDRVAAFAATAGRRLGRVHLRVLTPAAAHADAIIRASGLPPDAWSIASVPHEAVPGELRRGHAGLHFLANGISQHAGSPAKLGEYWASGLPVVVSPGMGDSERVIHTERIGAVVHEFSAEGQERALAEVLQLLEDPQLASRCRAAATKHYGAENAAAALRRLYADLGPRETALAAGSGPQVGSGS